MVEHISHNLPLSTHLQADPQTQGTKDFLGFRALLPGISDEDFNKFANEFLRSCADKFNHQVNASMKRIKEAWSETTK